MFQELFRHGQCSQGNVSQSQDQVRQTVSPMEEQHELDGTVLSSDFKSRARDSSSVFHSTNVYLSEHFDKKFNVENT
ncbi:MAG: hypothetical protein F4Z97_05370 [Gammaproteobacteria bacterium]|nr:hypothetical protein [Gammaproteobacteria bacterium]